MIEGKYPQLAEEDRSGNDSLRDLGRMMGAKEV
jgi:hypothetical protein